MTAPADPGNDPRSDAAPKRRRADSRGGDLTRALGVNVTALDSRTRAAVEALSEEVMALRDQVAELEGKLDGAELLADHDTLCPVFNRRAFERELRRETALAERYGSSLCLVYIDLDGFKAVNDSFGHATGDSVLIKVADILIAGTRETDIVARLGGDEFGVALTHASYEDSVRKAADLAARIDALIVRDMADLDGPVLQLGASCGVAGWQRGMTVDALLEEADRAMFREKATRRARTR